MANEWEYCNLHVKKLSEKLPRKYQELLGMYLPVTPTWEDLQIALKRVEHVLGWANEVIFKKPHQNQQNNGNNSQETTLPQGEPMDVDKMKTRRQLTNAQKEQFKKEGRCFNCHKQGHMASQCPTRKPYQNKSQQAYTPFSFFKNSNQSNQKGKKPSRASTRFSHQPMHRPP